MYLILASIYWGIFSRKKSVHWTRPVRFFFAGLLFVCVIMLVQKMGWYIPIEKGLEDVRVFRQDAVAFSGRTTYGTMLDTSSVLGFVKVIPVIFANYMFAPYPWHIENVKDIYAMLESMLRFVLLLFAVYSWRRSSGEVRSYYGFLLIVVLGMEFMWAFGTVNWGTAIRHHLPGYSVIVLLGAPGLILFLRRLHIEKLGRRKDNTMLTK
jgi:hypothetical protein